MASDGCGRCVSRTCTCPFVKITTLRLHVLLRGHFLPSAGTLASHVLPVGRDKYTAADLVV